MSDIDECQTGVDMCDSKAYCTNTAGSYTCTCKAGYEGEGFLHKCTGKLPCKCSAGNYNKFAQTSTSVPLVWPNVIPTLTVPILLGVTRVPVRLDT